MPVKEFTVGFSRTINLGNYESARVEASVTFDEQISPDALFEAQGRLRELLERTWKDQYVPREKK